MDTSNKPMSMSTKDYLLRTMSVRTKIPLKTIESVVNHQFQGMLEAMQTEDSVELSGFGKFLFNHKKAKKKYDKQISKIQMFESKLALPDLTEKQIASYTLKLENTIKMANEIKPKIEKQLNGDIIANVGGVEKPSDSTSKAERENRTDIHPSDGSM